MASVGDYDLGDEVPDQDQVVVETFLVVQTSCRVQDRRGQGVVIQTDEVVNGVYRRFTVTQNGPFGLPQVRVEVHYEVSVDCCTFSAMLAMLRLV